MVNNNPSVDLKMVLSGESRGNLWPNETAIPFPNSNTQAKGFPVTLQLVFIDDLNSNKIVLANPSGKNDGCLCYGKLILLYWIIETFCPVNLQSTWISV
ncbi:MAG: hypothetical protein HUJ21_11035 [Cyclobacterium sp.]|nr:hypothetical protein [Cyclobacterium sp.]